MGVAGISKKIRDILQQHDKSDISKILYDRYNYMKEIHEVMGKLFNGKGKSKKA